MNRRRMEPLTINRDDRVRINISLTGPEAREVETASDSLAPASFAKWAVLSAARKVNRARMDPK